MKIKKAIKIAESFVKKDEKEMSMNEMQAMTTILLDIHKMLSEQSKSAKFDLVINEQNQMALDAFNKMSGAKLEINDEIKLKKKEVKSFSYPAIITPEQNGYSVRFPDLNGVNTQGDTLKEAYINAENALSLFIESCLENDIKLPIKSKHKVCNDEYVKDIKVEI